MLNEMHLTAQEETIDKFQFVEQKQVQIPYKYAPITLNFELTQKWY